MELKGSVVFVTGASRGLGLAFAKAAVARGASKVYAGVRNPENVTIPGVTAVRLDVTNPASVKAAVELASDTTILVNNAGIARVMQSALDENAIDVAREIFETNYFGVVHVSQAFAPVLLRNGGGAIINVLSSVTWFSIPLLAAYAASKSAAWSFTNALRLSVSGNGTQVIGLHVGFMDTDLTKGLDVPKSDPLQVAHLAFDGVEAEVSEVLADDESREVKQSLSTAHPAYFHPPLPQ
ncbi:short-chain dehydrogenase [Robbsia andropogonis]|uniref:Short-chain dehydrogenase n=1 Tax=Robbsia andropogonis TaxID=28092 RepID=A0A0F5K4E2_9BURK|nr:SDR family oxidoreductase [Robbsia andropogonis]KKB65001.1 short-chain dehydrogenase [Robbsia andropogonis]MCP1118567.1 SDR family oxidoreductase [Robbsia andropogonis]MCP1128034.1 SDR family oxidoreductase [Robbsia andropogonis]